jgi:hypothetical protein
VEIRATHPDHARMETEAARVVWWAILAGGFLGGLARILLAAQVELPYAAREPLTGRIILVPGVLGDLLLGPIAALVLAGAGAATFEVQTAFDARGFWGPFAASVAAGLASAHILHAASEAAMNHIEDVIDAEIGARLETWIEENVA